MQSNFRGTYFLATASFIGLVLLVACGGSFLTQKEAPNQDLYKSANIKNGANLYDNWVMMKTTTGEGIKGKFNTISPVQVINPLYPGDKTAKNVVSSWRCKSCHGWGYNGRTWKSTENRVGAEIGGLFEVSGKPALDVFWVIAKGPEGHQFGEKLTQHELWDLTLFIKQGLIRTSKVISKEGKFKGNPQQGQILYRKACSDCHGDDGDAIDFRSKRNGVQGVSWRTNRSPEITLHRVRWGKYKSGKTSKYLKDMPSARVDLGLSDQDVVDILTYVQQM